MLIGIMHHNSGPPGEFSPFRYRSRILHACDIYRSNSKILTSEGALGVFSAFREEWRRSAQFLVPFDVSRSTGLCSDVVIEITKYLSLNDAINAFSLSILSLLQQTHSKLHLNNPTDRFLEMMPQYFDPRQIASLRITDEFLPSERHFSTWHTFDQVISLTIIVKRMPYLISSLQDGLPNVHRLSLWFGGGIILFTFDKLQMLSFHSVTHLHIRCADPRWDHSWSGTQTNRYWKNTTISSFIFDSEYYPDDQSRSILPCDSQRITSDLLRAMLKFIESLVNVQRVRLLTSQFQIDSFLQASLWRDLINRCVRLDRVILQLVGDGDWTQKAHDIEQDLRRRRPGMIFRIKNT
jgi:hypothetical protein